MKIPVCLKCDRTGFTITATGNREYCDCPAGDLSRILGGRRDIPRIQPVEDTVRVLRILEYTGPLSVVERTLARSFVQVGEGVTIAKLNIREITRSQERGKTEKETDNADTDTDTDPLDNSGSLGQPI